MSAARSPSAYSAVVGVVLFLAALNFAVILLRPQIPPPDPNPLEQSTEDFLAVAAQQEIRWNLPSREAFAMAQRLDRPILLVLGDQSSLWARQFDEIVFRDQDVINRIRTNFVPIRVDVVAEPWWTHQFLPLARAESTGGDDFQLLILHPSGELYQLVTFSKPPGRIDSQGFAAVLANAYRAYSQRIATGERTEQEMEQELERELLIAGTGTAAPDILGYLSRRLNEPAFENNRWVRWDPFLLALLSRANITEAGETWLNALTTSGMVDWWGGGLYRSGTIGVTIDPQFHKSLADMAVTTWALQGYRNSSNSASIRLAADHAFASLVRYLASPDPLPSMLFDPVDEVGRSSRASFSRTELRNKLTTSGRRDALELWNLGSVNNPLGVPIMIHDPEGPRADAARQVQSILQSGRVDIAEQPTNRGYLAHEAMTIAYALRAAQLRGEGIERLPWIDRLDHYRQIAVPGRWSSRAGEQLAPNLPDLLHASSALWEAFLISGEERFRVESLEILEFAIENHFDAEGWNEIAPISRSTAPDREWWPSLLDRKLESSVSVMIRLLVSHSHGLRLVGDEVKADDFRNQAQAVTLRYAVAANRISRRAAGFFLSASYYADDRLLVVEGADAQAVTKEILAEQPWLTVLTRPSSAPTALTLVRSTGTQSLPVGE